MKYGFLSKELNETIISPEIFKNCSDVRSGISTKLGGGKGSHLTMNLSYNVGDDILAVKANRKIFLSKFEISEEQLAVPLQCHSNNVMKIELPGNYKECDGLVTNVKHVALTVTIADCVPIILFDPVYKVIGAVHAGWRGTADGIAGRAVNKLAEEYRSDPLNLIAFIGPSAGACCYEVNEEVAVMFKNKIVPYKKGRAHIDLKQENKLQLQEAGVLINNIEVSTHCTICENSLFHSFRGDGMRSGRMMAVICLVE